MRVFVLGLLSTMTIAFALGCEPEIGGLCDPDKAKVNLKVPQEKGTNNLVQDVELDNCSEGFCLSTNDSRPYCTKKCQADTECVAQAGAGFVCQAVISFGPLACQDWEDPTKPRPGVTSTNATCSVDGDCTTAGEKCLGANAAGGDGKCGIPGRDCLTGNDQGTAPSNLPLKYCAASSVQVIKDRDKEYGRKP